MTYAKKATVCTNPVQLSLVQYISTLTRWTVIRLECTKSVQKFPLPAPADSFHMAKSKAGKAANKMCRHLWSSWVLVNPEEAHLE